MSNRNRMLTVLKIVVLSTSVLSGCSKSMDYGYDPITNVLVHEALKNDESISESGVDAKRKEYTDLQKAISGIVSELDNQNIEIIEPISKNEAFTIINRYAIDLYGHDILIDRDNIGDNGSEYYVNIIDIKTRDIVSAIKIDSYTGDLIDIIK